ncbi:hypothetical protein M405DRAFT_830118, partial [Rhizopogon salebrosus TDB-379]
MAGICLHNMVEAFPIIPAYIYPGPSTRHTDINLPNTSGALVPTTPNATSIKTSGTSIKPDLQDPPATQAEQLLAKSFTLQLRAMAASAAWILTSSKDIGIHWVKSASRNTTPRQQNWSPRALNLAILLRHS